MPGQSYSVFNALVDIIAAPGTALDEIKSHTSWLWWPLLISLLLAAGLFYYYYHWVDFPDAKQSVIRIQSEIGIIIKKIDNFPKLINVIA